MADSSSKHWDSPAAEEILDQFENAWQMGGNPDLADFLGKARGFSFDADSLRSLALDLMMVDLWHRWRRAAKGKATVAAPPGEEEGPQHKASEDVFPEQPRLEDYLRVYPELGTLDELPLCAIGEEYKARHRWGDRPDHVEYLERFKAFDSALEQALTAIDRLLAGDTVDVAGHTPRKRPVADSAAPKPKSPDAADIPERIGKYHVVGRLDEGGQALVYRALHPTLAKELVIKLGRYPIQPDHSDADHLAAEGRILAELDHPNLGRVYDLDVYEGRPYLVMEYIRGLTLRQYVEQHALPPREIAKLLAKIARALGVAHAKGVIHQDIKPKNILVDEAGEPRIIDFGMARLCHAWSEARGEPGMVSGTIQFMAPEQARGETDCVNHRSDIFALGAVLYLLLTGKTPYEGTNVLDLLARAGRCEFDATRLDGPGIPPRLREICLKAMRERPDERYISADAMAADLERFSRGLRRRNKAILAGAAVLLVLAVAVGRWIVHPRQPVSPSVGHALRQDFAVRCTPLGQAGPTPESWVLKEGQRIAFRIEADRDCYVGVWHVDPRGNILQLFPNEYDSDHRLVANQPRTIPGDARYAVQATVSEGPEFLHVVASTTPWKAEAGRQHGPYVVFASPEERSRWEERVRGLVVKKDDSPAVSELVLPFEVRAK